MANKTIADRLAAAKGTGQEAKFYATDATSTGTEYEFTPAGLATYIAQDATALEAAADYVKTDEEVLTAVATYVSADAGVLAATDASAITAVTAADIVVVGTDGLIAGTIQEALQDLAARIAVLEP